jgi:transposase
MKFTLDLRQRHALMEAAAATTDRHHWRRIRALLLLAEGKNVTETARALGTTRQSVYNWIHSYRRNPGPEGLADRPRPGRPPRLSAADRAVLRRLLDQERPADHGYDAPHWTVRLLLAQLERERGVRLSGGALRRTLHRMGYRWQGDRFALEAQAERKAGEALQTAA